jgi:hypothetical protein
MDCSIGIDAVDQGTTHIADEVQPHLEQLSARLSNDYGGLMEHLWVSLELCPAHADGRPPWTFRFQKRVSRKNGAKHLGLPIAPDAVDPKNVGHFSVRPDYFELAQVPLNGVAAYLLEAIYRAATVLEKKNARLGGFDAGAFRRDILLYVDENWPIRKRT